MKTILIILSLLIAGCASQQIKPTTIPEIIINYECQIDQADKDSLHQAILNSATCNTSEPVYITITHYNTPTPIQQFVGLSKGFYIKGNLTYKNTTKNIGASVINPGILTSTFIAGIPGFIASTANLSRDMKNAEQALAKFAWKHIRKIK
jgi:hypothetical protein